MIRFHSMETSQMRKEQCDRNPFMRC